MRRKASAIAAVTLASGAWLAAPAAAQAPTQMLSGTYSLSYIERCQTTISYSTDATTGSMSSVNTVDGGKISDAVLTAAFDGTGTVTFTGGGQNKGDLLIVQNNGGNAIAAEAPPTSATYSTTSNSFTIVTDQSQTFNAVYARVSGGVAAYMVFLGLESGKPGCFVHGEAVLQ
jgi:hypothetical protein